MPKISKVCLRRMPQPKMWNRMNKTNRHLVRRPWARAWLRGYVCDYSLMTSSDGLMLQWRHWAGPLATHQPEQSVTHGSLLLITKIPSRKHTKAQVHFATSAPHVSPESGSASSGCRRRDKRRILCTLFAYKKEHAWNIYQLMLEIKSLWEKSASKSHITASLQGWYEGKDKMQCNRKQHLRSRQIIHRYLNFA